MENKNKTNVSKEFQQKYIHRPLFGNFKTQKKGGLLPLPPGGAAYGFRKPRSYIGLSLGILTCFL